MQIDRHFKILMKTYTRKLSKDFKFEREDLYELENELRLGELTFIIAFFDVKIKEIIMLTFVTYQVFFLDILIINQQLENPQFIYIIINGAINCRNKVII